MEGPRPHLLRNVDWSFPTLAAMQAALDTLDGFTPESTMRAAGRDFVLKVIDGRMTAVEMTERPPLRTGFNDVALTRLPVLEELGLLGNPNDYADFAQLIPWATVLTLLGVSFTGSLDSGGLDLGIGDGTTPCKIRFGRSTTSAVSGTVITFNTAMNGCNNVLLSSRNDGADPLATVNWTNITGEGFTVHGFLTGTGARVARDFTYIAVGR